MPFPTERDTHSPPAPFTLPNDEDLFRLQDSIGERGANNRQDIIKAQILLGNAGYYDLLGLGGPTGWAGGELTRAVRQYQKDRGLTVDGVMLPDGETLQALSDDLFERLSRYRAPSPAEADRHHEARAQRGEDDGIPVASGIAMPDRPDHADHPPGVRMPDISPPRGSTLSDEPSASPAARPGAQYAQIAVPAPVSPMPPPVAGGTGSRPVGVLPQDAPEVKAAAREIERRLGYAKDNAGRWMDQARDAASQLPNLLQGFIPDSIGLSPPSQPIGEADKAQAQTPPLMPSAPPEEPPPGRPNEAIKSEPEELIPPQLQEWAESFPQIDPEFLKELLVVTNSNGDEHTQLGNRIFVQEYLTELAENYPEAAKVILHAAGGHSEGKIDKEKLREEYLRNAITNGRIGSTRPDIAFELKEEIVQAIFGPEASERHRINTQTMANSGDRPIKRERVSATNLRINAKGQQVDTVPKLRPDADGAVSEGKQAAYRRLMRERAAEMIPRWIADLKSKGLL